MWRRPAQSLLFLQPLVLFFFLHVNFFFYLFVYFFFFCSDVNECVRGLHKWSSDAFCNNTKGSYNCTCKHGFKGNGRECKGRRWIHLQPCDEKIKLPFANYPQRNDKFYLDPHSKFYSRSPKCFCTEWNESLFSDFIHPLLDRLFKAT